MKTLRFYLLIISAFLLNTSCQNKQTIVQENSKDWKQIGNATWSYSNDDLIASVNNEEGYVITKQTYNDFTLELEFKPDSTINSGIFIRCKNEDINPTNCYELNIWDLSPNQDYRTGSVVTKSKSLAIVKTICCTPLRRKEQPS